MISRRAIWLGSGGLLVLGAAVFVFTQEWVSHRRSATRVIGRPAELSWEHVDPPGRGRGLVRPEFITNAEIEESDSKTFRADAGGWSSMSITPAGTRRVAFEAGPVVRFDVPLLERRVRNVWGMTLLRWFCAVEGAFSGDGRQYCFSLRPSGGGHAGYTVSFEGDYDPLARILTVRFTEGLWSGRDARRYAARFRVDRQGNFEEAQP